MQKMKIKLNKSQCINFDISLVDSKHMFNIRFSTNNIQLSEFQCVDAKIMCSQICVTYKYLTIHHRFYSFPA